MFLTSNLEKLYEFTIIPSFTSQLILKRKGDVNRMTTLIEAGGNKKFDNVNRNNVNRGDVNRRITVMYMHIYITYIHTYIHTYI